MPFLLFPKFIVSFSPNLKAVVQLLLIISLMERSFHSTLTGFLGVFSFFSASVVLLHSFLTYELCLPLNGMPFLGVELNLGLASVCGKDSLAPEDGYLWFLPIPYHSGTFHWIFPLPVHFIGSHSHTLVYLRSKLPLIRRSFHLSLPSLKDVVTTSIPFCELCDILLL